MNQNVDVYRNIHKGIRRELFTVTTTAAELDPSDECGRVRLSERIEGLVWLLGAHAHHEDRWFLGMTEEHAPRLAERIVTDHAMLDARIEGIGKAARETETRAELHELYLDLAGFTGTYLAHQDLEERDLQPILLDAVGPQVMFETEQALVASIAPEDMARTLAYMLPAMNLDDRGELLGGIRLGAPAEVFAGICALAGSVLQPADMAALATRLGL
jgi:hypothetical protein